jgi:hypothetical protein
MNLQDFATLADAHAHTETTYRKIGGNEASQILAKTSALDNIEANSTSTVSVEVVAGDPTTVGALCRTVIRTLTGGQFATDPNTEDGAVNRGSSALLVAAGVLTQAQIDNFYAKSEVIETPFLSATKHTFEVAKGIANKTAVTVEQGYCTITTTADCDAHRPQVYRKVTFTNGDVEYIRVAGFNVVELAGLYRTQCPSFTNMYIDDVYSVITQG